MCVVIYPHIYQTYLKTGGKTLKPLSILVALCLICFAFTSCEQEPLNLSRFDDNGFITQGEEYDTLIEMERPYGRTLAASCEVNGVPSDMTLVVNEDGTGKLTISNDNGIDELDGTWTDWANFNLIYQDWPEKGKDMLLKKHGIYLRFAGEEPGTTGLKPSDFDIRITFTYEFDTCDVREAENGKYLIYSPLKGSPVDFKSLMSSKSPLMQPLWRVMD